ncbi:glycosyl hydrolase family 28-related protein [Aquirhabdus parva]|uniref:Rhamnogalacturonase A/B/Epimerase-like pectate lyase domain-containing protein n=1 Tax=Aquirhabdus parva TaxID=2283318 RepID=A0A345P3W5_9GAMM|nr:glycosyl hydrolase family 28-related protein [Aquirhabdus parva]AXI01974.1 hypothetical protein HYN46_03285 [Aquirhabdus parva]
MNKYQTMFLALIAINANAETATNSQKSSQILNQATPISQQNDLGINRALAASNGANLVGFLQRGNGAVSRTLQSKLQDTINARDYGVKCDGSSDDTNAINTAIKANSGKEIVIPAGKCLYKGGGILGDGTVLRGAGRNATYIIAALPNSILFSASGYGSGIRDIGFNAGPPQTNGTYVVLSGTESFIEDFFMNGDYNGVLMTGKVARIRHGRFQSGAKGSIRIRAEGGDTSQLIDDVMIGAQQPEITYAGIRVRNSAALIISNTSVIQQNIGLLVDPYTSHTGSATDAGNVSSLWVHDSFFDTQTLHGIQIAPSGSASIVRSRFANIWASSSGSDGVSITNQSSGSINGLHFESLHTMDNKGSGVNMSGAMSDIAFLGGIFSGNANGLSVNSPINGLRITDATIGTGGGFPANSGAGIRITQKTSPLLIADNTVVGNKTAIQDYSGAVSNKLIRSNVGFNPIANTPLSVTASPMKWQNTTGDTVQVFINAGKVSSITVEGNIVATSTNTSVIVPQGASIEVLYSALPKLSYLGF